MHGITNDVALQVYFHYIDNCIHFISTHAASKVCNELCSSVFFSLLSFFFVDTKQHDCCLSFEINCKNWFRIPKMNLKKNKYKVKLFEIFMYEVLVYTCMAIEIKFWIIHMKDYMLTP